MSTIKLRKAKAIEAAPELAVASDPGPVYAIATGLHLGEGPSRQEIFTCTACSDNSSNWIGATGATAACPHCKEEHEVVPFAKALEKALIPFDSDWCLGVWLDDLMAAWVRKLRLDGASIT